MNGFTSLTAQWSWRLARSDSVSELVNPCSSHAILSTRGRLSAPQPRSSILTNPRAKFKSLPPREQAIEKSYSAKQIDGLKRVFEAHGMILTGPPLDG